MAKNESGTNYWNMGLRLWWAVTWRTFLWISLPVMVVQFVVSYLKSPEMTLGMLGLFWTMAADANTMLNEIMRSPEFWFFIAVTVYGIVGSVFVYGYLMRKGRFGGLDMTVKRGK